MSDFDALIDLIAEHLSGPTGRARPLPPELAAEPQLAALLGAVRAYQQFAVGLANGNLSQSLPLKGPLAGSMKALQANLRHLTWQAQMIANGDLSQRVDFMGEFAEAFNKMTASLEDARRQLSASEERFRKLVHNSSDIIAILDQAGLITYLSPSVEKILGWNAAEMIGSQVLDQIHPDDRTQLAAQFEQLVENGGGISLEVRLRHANGSFRVMEALASNQVNEATICGILINSRDITERKQLYETIEHLAMHDPLTGCYNRRQLFTAGEKEFARSRRYNRSFTMVMFDIDHFKLVNDTYGHQVGDEILRNLVLTCQSQLRSSDIFGRYGGEEFLVFLPETDMPAALATAERLRLCVAEKIMALAGEHQLGITISLGVAGLQPGGMPCERGETPGPISGLEDLVKQADDALYAAKAAGRNCVRHCACR